MEQNGWTRKTSCDTIILNKSHKMVIPSASERNQRMKLKVPAITVTTYPKIEIAYSSATLVIFCCRITESTSGGGGGTIFSTSVLLPGCLKLYPPLTGLGACRCCPLVEPG